jgi:hypothetical protein
MTVRGPCPLPTNLPSDNVLYHQERFDPIAYEACGVKRLDTGGPVIFPRDTLDIWQATERVDQAALVAYWDGAIREGSTITAQIQPRHLNQTSGSTALSAIIASP